MTQLAAMFDMVVEKLSGPNAVVLGLVLATSLAASLGMFLATYDGPRSLRHWLRFAFPQHVLSHPSARADFLFWVTRKLVMRIVLVPASASVTVGVAFATHAALGWLLGIEAPVREPAGPWTIILFTLTGLITYDLSYYLYHAAQHRVPILWELHKVHHSAEVMVGITKDRIHPLDELMNRVWDGVFVGVVFGIWYFFAVDLVEVTILGISVYAIRNILMMDFIRHTHLPVSFGPLNNFVLCPHWHQLHHSVDPRHYDRNFGLLLSVWDRMFGTACRPEAGERFTFGIGNREGREYQSLYGLYVLPLRRMADRALSRVAPDVTGREDGRALELVEDPERLEAVLAPWEALEARAGAGVFQSHAWIGAWWRAFGASRGFRLHVVLAWSGQDLVGVLPLVIHRHRGLRVLRWAANDCTDYCDALIAPGPEAPAILAALWQEAEQAGGFDIVMLTHVRSGTSAAALPAAGRRVTLRQDRRSTVATGVRLDAWPDPAAFFRDLGKKGRNNDQRGRRILAQHGPVRFRLVESGPEIESVLEHMRQLKLEWLLRTGSTSPLLADDGTLLRALVGVLIHRGCLRLHVLEAGGQLTAGLLSMAEGPILRAFLSAFDPDFQRASPGTLLLVDVISWAMAEGFAEVDFLRGDEGYKGRLTNREETLVTWSGSGTTLGRVGLALDRYRASLRARRDRTPVQKAPPGPSDP